MRVICLCCQSSMNRLKVLFLNNAIDQGVYYPLGMQQASVNGKSIFFMVASNPVRAWGCCWRLPCLVKG